MDIDKYIQRLLDADPLRKPVLRSIIRNLHLPPGSNGIDVGCGIGLQALLLVEAVGPEGHVTGMDILPEFFSYGENLVAEAGYSDRVTFRQGDMSHIPFDDCCFDWVWSADCAGYPAGEMDPLLEELKRVVTPGGSIILLAWTSQQVLPGHPLLEARLNATCSSYIPYLKDKTPEMHFLRALSAFRNAGLIEVKAQTFIGEVQSPLSNSERTALSSLFEMLWEQPQTETALEDWKEIDRLCTPGSADFILDIPDYYAFFTITMFRGRVPTN
jgi:demethylmenaquinone methyltransferase/2-methoxy-6-polyprenyl-1,4-benzoquinol methylase